MSNATCRPPSDTRGWKLARNPALLVDGVDPTAGAAPGPRPASSGPGPGTSGGTVAGAAAGAWRSAAPASSAAVPPPSPPSPNAPVAGRLVMSGSWVGYSRGGTGCLGG